jgi:hypothetical protein
MIRASCGCLREGRDRRAATATIPSAMGALTSISKAGLSCAGVRCMRAPVRRQYLGPGKVQSTSSSMSMCCMTLTPLARLVEPARDRSDARGDGLAGIASAARVAGNLRRDIA